MVNGQTSYVDGRFAEQLAFYDARASMYKRWHRVLSIYVIVVSAALTVCIALDAFKEYSKPILAIMSASIVVVTSLQSHYKCHENWLSYRKTWDAMKREHSYLTGSVGAYAVPEGALAIFIQRIEAILSKEAMDFYSRHEKSDGEVAIRDGTGAKHQAGAT